jgi:hypothetical protein
MQKIKELLKNGYCGFISFTVQPDKKILVRIIKKSTRTHQTETVKPDSISDELIDDMIEKLEAEELKLKNKNETERQ